MNGYGLSFFMQDSVEKEISDDIHVSHGIFEDNILKQGQEFIYTEGAEGIFINYSEGFYNH